jgi:uncharacterized membrane protein (UPF0127 family)
MSQLIHKGNIILPNVNIMKSIWRISVGLMFARKKTVEQGACLVMPRAKNLKYGCAITMYFCFYPYHILFVNSDMEVVDRIVLKPFRASYVPKKPAKYVFESTAGKFNDIKIGDKVELVE